MNDYIEVNVEFAPFITWIVKKDSIPIEKVEKELFDWRKRVNEIVKMSDEEYQDFLTQGPNYQNKVEKNN